jgi:hypothetical protein
MTSYIAEKDFGNGYIAQIYPLIYGSARIGYGPKDSNSYDDVW